MNKVTAVVLAAGLGTRMKTETPKVLHYVGSRPILGRVISNIKKAGISDIVVVVGYKDELIKEVFGEDVRYVRQPELLGSGNAVACAVNQIKDMEDSILITYGDAPLTTAETYRDLVDTHLKEKASCTFLTCQMQEPLSYGRIIRDKEGNVLKIIEEKDATREEKAIKEVNEGTYCFRSIDLCKFVHDIEVNEKKKEFYLTDIIEILVQEGEKVLTRSCVEEETIGINSRKDLAMVNKIINKKTLEKLMESGVTIVDPESTYIDEDAVIGRDTVVFPCTVIESDVVVEEECQIGPFARLRSGTKIGRGVEVGNYAELCRTEVGEFSKIKHQSYLGDAKIGRRVNVGAGTITANYDGKNKNRTVIEDEAFIGVGAMLVAPVKIGKGAVVGAGSVVTKNKDVGPGETVAGVPAKPLTARK